MQNGLLNGGAATKNTYIDEISKDPSIWYKSGISGGVADPFSQLSSINNTFRFGKWLNSYTLPLLDSKNYNNDMYFFDVPQSSWSTFKNSSSSNSSSSDNWFQSAGTFGTEIANAINLIHTPLATSEGTLLKTPIWQPVQGTVRKPIGIELTLINDTSLSIQDGWIFRNYEFMQNFITGTMPVSMYNSVMQSPNLYRVIIPGKVRFHWASVTVTATSIGKQYKIPQLSKKLNKKYGILSINQDTLWPQGWKLNITIQDLLPVSFTTYADYLMNDPATRVNGYKTESGRPPNEII